MRQEAIGNADVSAQVADQAAADAAVDDQQQNPDVAPKTEREIQLEAIKARRTEELDAEHELAVEQGLAAPKGGQNAGDAKLDALDPEAPVFKQDGKWVTKIKVNGQEKIVPFDHVVRTAQKNDAADARLHQAGEIVRKAEADAKVIREKAVLEASQSGKQPSSNGDAAVDDDAQAVADRIVSELVDGTPKDAAKLLAQAIRGAKAATPAAAPAQAVDKSQIVAAVLELDDHKAKVGAVQRYQKNHPELAGDKVLNAMVDAESASLLADESFSYGNYDELMSEAVNRVKERVRAVAGVPETTAINDRNQRKLAASAPGVGTTARRTAPQQPQAPTGAEKLARMRAGRGQG